MCTGPLCYESIRAGSLKVAECVPPVLTPSVGDTLSFRLLRRWPHSSVPVPRAAVPTLDDADQLQVNRLTRLDSPHLPRAATDADVTRFARCFQATRNAATRLVREQRSALQREFDCVVDDAFLPFLVQAGELVDALEQRLQNCHSLPAHVSSPRQHLQQEQQQTGDTERPSAVSSSLPINIDNNITHTAAFSDDGLDPHEYPEHRFEMCDEDHHSPTSTTTPAATSNNDEPLWLYQLDDGRPLFLHRVCWNALIAEHGSVTRLPDTVRGVVVEIEKHQMEERERRKFGALAYLPPSATFFVVELDVQKLVSARAASAVAAQLDNRRQRRKAIAARAKRDERYLRNKAQLAARARAENIERLGHGGRGRQQHHQQAPPDLASFEVLAASPTSSLSSSPSLQSSLSTSPHAAHSSGAGRQAWLRLQQSRGVVAVGSNNNDDDELACYAAPSSATHSLMDFLSVKPSNNSNKQKNRKKKNNRK